ncbi:TonB-dependent receptor [Caulobacter sp. BK020]|uniref:TonB-dependent receptor n=1 Tax=Caulobacter sp. BK020 TaxID=2512117 RepID=UPI0014055049|nr:TonB-dependent receptor [Caulobacter sp. BK020]
MPREVRAAGRDRRQACLAAILALSLAPTVARAAATRSIDLPAQPLSAALLTLSRQTGTIIIAPAALVRGRAAPAVRGRLEPAEAVRRLLRGSGLDLSISAGGVISIRAAPPPPAIAPTRPRLLPPEDSEPAALSTVLVVARDLGSEALRMKRLSAQTSDILLGEDLRGLADPNLGGAMQLLPGVAVTNDGGEGRQVSVRGVGGEFTRVRINGMETLATFGGTNAGGGTNRGRAFDFNVFAADLFNQIRLRKTPSADVDEGSLGATVDLQTRSPLDGPRSRVQLTVEGAYNFGADKAVPRLSAIVSRRSRDDRFGILVSAAYSKRAVEDVGVNAGQWQTGDTVYPGFGSTATGAPDLTALNAALHPRIPRLEMFQIEQERLGLTGSLQWRPSNRTQVALDVLYAELSSERREDLLETFTLRTAGPCRTPPNADCGIAAVKVRDATITSPRPGLPVLIAGAFDNVDVRAESRLDRLKTIFRQTTLSISQRLSDRLILKALAGYSRSDFGNPLQATVQLDQYDVQGFAYDFRDRRRPRIDFGSADLTTPANWTLAELRSEPNWVDNSFKTVGADLEWTLREGLTLRGGLQHKAYDTEATAQSRSNGTIANLNADIPPAFAAIPPSAYLRQVWSNRFATAAGTPDAWLAPDVAKAFVLFQAACAFSACGTLTLGAEPLLGLNYVVEERDSSAYLQAAFAVPWPWSPRGDLGLRYAHTGQVSRGFTLDLNAPGFVAPVSARRNYDDLLPSFNLALEPREDLLLRFAAARVMARPDLRSLRPGVTVSTGGLRSVSAGDPFLRPTRADTLDTAVEWYFAPGSVLSVAVFHKTIRSNPLSVATTPTVFADNPYGLPDSVAATACGRLPGCAPALPIWQFLTRTDRGGGHLDGLELALQAPLDLAAPALSGWSVRAGLTYTRARMRFQDLAGAPFIAHDSLGSPRLVGTFTSAYRRNGLDLRATLSHRGRYLTAIPASTGADVDGVNGHTSLDVSARYQLAPGWWLTAAGGNLLNGAQRQFSDTSGLANYQHHTGREIRVGLEMRY